MEKITIYYDGDCPLCTNFALNLRLRQKFALENINIREQEESVQYLKNQGFDINKGFIIEHEGMILQGEKGVRHLEMLVDDSDLEGKLKKLLFGNPLVVKMSYPLFKAARCFLYVLQGKSSHIKT